MEKLHRTLKIRAVREDISLQQLIIKALYEYLENHNVEIEEIEENL